MGEQVGAGSGRPAVERGQVIVLFALGLVALSAMAGLLLDGGRAWADQRQAQAAADTAALAAARAAATGSAISGAAGDLAAANGFPADLVDCAGVTQPGKGVVVNRPPLSGLHSVANDPRAGDYVEVITTRALRTTFAAVVGQGCWLVSARAVASVPSTGVAECNFCVLSDWQNRSTFLVDNGASMRVDGGIMVNADNWYQGTEAVNRCGASGPDPTCTPPTCSDWNGLPSDSRIRMCGDSIYIAHSGGATDSLVSANTIAVNGGWQTARYQDVLRADTLASGCLYHPLALAWPFPDNVCIGMPQIADPLNDPSQPEYIVPPPDPSGLTVPVAGQNGCPDGASVPTGSITDPRKLQIQSNYGYYVICPGLYYGGFSVSGDSGSPIVSMIPGIYFMVGGGFSVRGTASIDGSGGVMVYNSSGLEAFSDNTVPGDNLVPPCDPGVSTCVAPIITGTGNGLSGSPSSVAIYATVTYQMRVQAVSGQPAPTGVMSFYDGEVPIAGCTDLPVAPVTGSTTKVQATCSTSYSFFGTRWITGVYYGDAVYAPIGDTFKETIDPPDGEGAQVVMLDTITTPCYRQPEDPPCGQVLLHAPTSGRYAGLLIFQGRQAGLGLRIWPAAGADACTGAWMTDGVPPDANPVPAPCGPLGGLSGTIYAPHQSTGSDDWDAVVNLNADGLANVQIIAAEVFLTYDRDVRFTYDPSQFANGRLHLVE